MSKNIFQTSIKEKIDPIMMRVNVRTTGDLKIPIINKCDVDISTIKLIAVDHTKKLARSKDLDKTIHFFVDDHKFEKYFYNADTYITRLAQYPHVLSPDFSLYINMPVIMQLTNLYKNRFCGAYWQLYGLSVIPTVSWSNTESYSFCFEGIEYGSVVAISTIGSKKFKKLFLRGYDEMKKRINPKQVLCYDEPFPEMGNEVIYAPYPKHQGE